MQFDAVVIGGGPAGASAGIRLAQLGHSVCVVERPTVPRQPSIESVSPGFRVLMEIMGTLDPVLQEKFIEPELTLIRWGEREVQRKRQLAGQSGMLVERSRFDRVLLQAAMEAGAHVIRPAVVCVPKAYHNGVWRLEARCEGAATIECRYLIDASGKQGFLERGDCDFPGRRIVTAPPTVAICGCLQSEFPPRMTMVEAIAEAWVWGASLSGGGCAAMVFCDTEKIRSEHAKGLEAIWRGFLKTTKLFPGLDTARSLGPVRLRDATPSFHEVPMGKGFVRAGESNYSIDPLSSTGVEKAMRGGLTAAMIVHTLLKYPERASMCEQFCLARQQEDVQTHAAWAAGFYSEAAHLGHHVFWNRRSRLKVPEFRRMAAQEQQDVPAAVAHRVWTWGNTIRIRLADGVQLRREPCVVNDEIQAAMSILSPELERPVAFLDGIPLGPVMDEAFRAMPSDLFPCFAKHLSAKQIGRVWHWLLEKRVFEIISAEEQTGHLASYVP